MRYGTLRMLPLALLLTAAAPVRVTLGPPLQRKLAIVTAPLVAGAATTSVGGIARVLDTVPLATLDSDIAVAVATAAASQAEASRSAALHAADATVALRTVEAARAQARGDAARLLLLRRRLGLEWGAAIARLSDRQRSALVAALAAGRAALVRIDSASGAGLAHVGAVMLDLGGGMSAPLRILGPARTAEARLTSPGLLAIAQGRSAAMLSVGLSLPVRLPLGGGASGVIVPASALLRLDGGTWAWIQRGPAQFERRLIEGARPAPGGLLAPGGFAVGEQVVVRGASVLHAAEHPATAAAADED